jgi:hypothetical protein
MLEAATLLGLYAAMVALYFRRPERPPGIITLSRRAGIVLGVLVSGLIGWTLFLSVAAAGWAAGLGLWSTAAMLTGIAAPSLAEVRPAVARRSAAGAMAAALILPLIAWGVR